MTHAPGVNGFIQDEDGEKDVQPFEGINLPEGKKKGEVPIGK